MRITVRDGRVLTLTALGISGDSVIGLRRGAGRDPARVAVALTDVRAVEDRRVDPGRTRELVVIVARVAAALALPFIYVVASVSTT
ncbi:hypothetical protein tb265_13550 [Gemmatimonadetes bacterium T265]|nr:hypothetical protein tb265_13550 [Gemmatimonadetes bacterium T265]